MTRRSTISGPMFQIMLSIAEEPRHGYGIKLDVHHRTGGKLKLGSGTLYEAIQRMESRGWIEEVPPPRSDTPSERDAGRRFYSLTKVGREAMGEELVRLEGIVQFAKERDLMPET